MNTLLALIADGALSVTTVEIALGGILLTAFGALFGAATTWGALRTTVTQLESVVKELKADVAMLRGEIVMLREESAEQRGAREATGNHGIRR